MREASQSKLEIDPLLAEEIKDAYRHQRHNMIIEIIDGIYGKEWNR